MSEQETTKMITAGKIEILMITGQIEGHTAASGEVKSTKYEEILPIIAAIEESSEIDGLLILINTVGGDVEAGLAIAEGIAGMNKPTVSLVLGGGHSIGIPLAVSAKRSFIVPSASMIIHPVRMNGIVLGVAQSFNYLAKMQERINSFIINHSKVTLEDLNKLLLNTDEMSCDIGSILYGSEAVEVGIIDSVGSVCDALGELHRLIDAKKAL
jgi:ATP-dependent protease ClpP protease subunit